MPVRVSPRVDLELALDEVLLTEGACGARLWTSSARAVVLGVSSKVGLEVRAEVCHKRGVDILRRMSGGATVLVAGGVLCFSLYLPYASVPEAATIGGAYRRAIGLLGRAFGRIGIHSSFEPPCDVTTHGQKLVGMAQARRRVCAMVHGVIPVDLSLGEVAALLPHPPEEPSYRLARAHGDFMTTVHAEMPSCTIVKVVAALEEVFEDAALATVELTPERLEAARALVERKYADDCWTYRR